MMTAHAGGHHAPPQGFLWKYIFSKDHKVIGIQYLLLALVAVFTGLILSVFMRIRIAWPDLEWIGLNAQLTSEQYLALVTMHGTIMVFMVLTTAPQGGFGNYFLPIQIGAADMAFPTLNMLSFWTTFASFVVLIAAFFVPDGAPIGGWTGYPPLSAIPSAGPGQGPGMNMWIISIALFCAASLMGSINFIATTLDLRARGMSLLRMPLTVWAWFVTAVLSLLAFGVLLAAGVLLLLDRVAGTSFFVPGGLVVTERLITEHRGGSPLLWQHLFWFFGHPEVYIAILPGMGLASHLLSTFSRKPIFGYRAMVYAICAIGFLGFVVWGHHMFASGMNPMTAMAFSMLTMSIGVPSAIKTFNWLGTLWGGSIRFTTPMLYALGFVSLFVVGGLSGLFLAQPAVDQPLHDGYFVVAHFHLIMGVAAIFGIFAGIYFWFPKMFGRMMNDTLGRIHFWITFIGVYAVFMPMHYMGMAGQPRRYADGLNFNFLAPLQPIQEFITYAAIVTAAAQLIFLANFLWSLWRGRKPASDNPWEATTLEWSIPSPPPHDNFAGQFPTVYRGAYEFSVPGATEDYLPQHLAPEKIATAGK
jgi:cytochrome c oxidase subunit 1